MFIEYINSKNKFIVELWDTDQDDFTGFREPRPEDFYVIVNDWCIKTFGYHARTAFNRFEFRAEKDLTMFILRWNSES
jgi:hypothetical protein